MGHEDLKYGTWRCEVLDQWTLRMGHGDVKYGT